MSEIRLIGLTRDNMRAAAQIYVAIWGGQVEELLGFFQRNPSRPHYYGLLAVIDQQIVGMGFGAQSLAGDWWHDAVAARVGKAHPALQSAWTLIELGVIKSYRDHGIGSHLLSRLIDQVNLPNFLLSTHVRNGDAQRFYRRHGWQVLHPGFIFPSGIEPYMIMNYRKDTHS
ncbi:MAG: GNAT family N-acetyltransferase [Anaerolineae bacterium]|jgi:ribosomal protein S18 acetylase RimI-like enzyme|nr:GNAT family N-acetyltransferase [Anaerolineae bacterium]